MTQAQDAFNAAAELGLPTFDKKYVDVVIRGIKETTDNPSAAGNNTEVQFNDNGVLAGNANFTFDKTTTALSGGAFVPTGNAAPTNGLYLPSANKVAISTNGTGKLFIDASGNVGAGTLSPENYGSGFVTVEARGTSADGGGIFQTRSFDASVKSYFYCDSSTDTGRIGTITNHPFLFVTNTSERLRITSTGELKHIGGGSDGDPAVYFAGSAPAKSLYVEATTGHVGLGTSSPSALCHIHQDSGATLYKASVAGNSTVGLEIVKTGSTTQSWRIVDGQTVNGKLEFYDVTDSATRMCIDGSGNVGVGTTSPGTKFEINEASDSDTGIYVRARGGDAKKAHIFLLTKTAGGSNTGGTIFHDGAGLAFNTGTTTSSEVARIDSSGRLLVGTASYSGGTRAVFRGNTAAAGTQGVVVLQRDGANPGTTQSLGEIRFVDSNDGWGASISAFGDATWSSPSDCPTKLVFSTTANGESSPTERMRIDSAGQVAIGGSPSAGIRATITAGSGGGQALRLLPGGAGDVSVAQLTITKFDNDTTSSQYFAQFNINNGAAASGRIVANGANQAAFASTSDIRLKENVQDLPSQLEKICSLRPVEFDYIESEGGGHQIGFIAQELQEIYPDAVSAGADENHYLSVTGWSKTEARLVKALQEAVAKIESLEARVAALEAN